MHDALYHNSHLQKVCHKVRFEYKGKGQNYSPNLHTSCIILFGDHFSFYIHCLKMSVYFSIYCLKIWIEFRRIITKILC